MTIIIRHLPQLDRRTAAELLAIQIDSYRVEAELIGYPALPPLFESVDDLLECGETFVAAHEGAGYVGAASYVVVDGTMDIGRMIVAPRAFRRGVASAILGALEEAAAGNATMLVSTAEANIPAIRLYQKHGFDIVRRTSTPDGLALVNLEKQLRK